MFKRGMRHCNHGNMRTSTLHVDLGVHKQRSALAKTLIIDHKSEKWQSKCLRRFTIQWHCQSSRYGLLIIQCSPNGHACNANSVQNMNSKFQQLCGTDQQDSEIVWSYMEENWPPLKKRVEVIHSCEGLSQWQPTQSSVHEWHASCQKWACLCT